MQTGSLPVQHIKRMASYNQLMNQKVYDTAAQLTPAQLAEDRGAFFGSVLGTLNHIVVADTVWLQRFASALPTHAMLEAVRQLPTPTSLDAVVMDNLPALRQRRAVLDDAILAFSNSVTEEELISRVTYKNMKGVPATKQLFGLLMHFFNHQTHHRGQTTTLLTQCGLDVGVTDLLALVPET
jgi:uncharacterized damage-inducible protein DinB